MTVLLAILKGVPITLLITVAAFAIGAIGGIVLALGRHSRLAPLRWLSVSIIEILRGIPPVVWLFIIYFGFGTVFPQLNSLGAAIIGLGVVSTAYLAEIYRGGLRSIPHGQWEAGDALSMSRLSTLRDIVGPQIVRVSIPAAATYAIGLIKDSSVAYTIGVMEIVYFANEQSRRQIDAIGPFLIAAAVYIIMTIPCAWGARALDDKLRKGVAR